MNADEVAVVRRIFQLYETHRCLNAVVREAQVLGIRSKRHVFSTGRTQGGNSFSRGQIYHLLTNPVYLGLIRHKDQTFDGQHPAIIEQALWDSVQRHLQSASVKRRGAPAGHASGSGALLKGKVRDETGDILTPTHTVRRGKRQRYYVSNRLISGGPDPTAWRLPAATFEQAVVDAIAGHLEEQATQHAVLKEDDIIRSMRASRSIMALAGRLRTKGCKDAAPLILAVTLGKQKLDIQLDPDAVATASGLNNMTLRDGLFKISTTFACKRRGVETRIIAGQATPEPDQTLIRSLRNAHAWSNALRSGEPLKVLAQRVGHSERYTRRIISLISLSPRFQSAILDGTQPPHMNLEALVRGTIPLDWNHQERVFGPHS